MIGQDTTLLSREVLVGLSTIALGQKLLHLGIADILQTVEALTDQIKALVGKGPSQVGSSAGSTASITGFTSAVVDSTSKLVTGIFTWSRPSTMIIIFFGSLFKSSYLKNLPCLEFFSTCSKIKILFPL
jgi:hypothetical protein